MKEDYFHLQKNLRLYTVSWFEVNFVCREDQTDDATNKPKERDNKRMIYRNEINNFNYLLI